MAGPAGGRGSGRLCGEGLARVGTTTHRGRAWADARRRTPSRPQHSANSHCKWVGSTSLLCYGQMAMQSRKQILPWVDNIASRMVYYYSRSCYVSAAAGGSVRRRHPVLAAAPRQLLTGRRPTVHRQDHTLKKSFLSAAVMLMKALKRESSTLGYKFTQTAELVHCLVVRRGAAGWRWGPRGPGRRPSMPSLPALPVRPAEGA